MFEEAQQYIRNFRNTLVKEYGNEATKHFLAKTNYPITLSAHNESQIDISEDDDEILISKFKKKKDTYSMVLVEGMEMVQKDTKNKEQNTSNRDKQNQQNESQNEMSGLTIIREEAEDQTIENKQSENKMRKQVTFQGKQEDKNECESKQTRSGISEEKSQEDNNSRMSGFTSVLESNSLTTNIWDNSEDKKLLRN